MSEKKHQLEDHQIKRLFEFVESKYVRFKDIQFEIVDHLASGIEEIQENDPSISFETALRKVYGGFPITGFAKFVEGRSLALVKFWYRRFWTYLKEFFKLPKIIITILLTILLYTAFSIFGGKLAIYFGIGGMVLWFILLLRLALIKYTQKVKQKQYLVIATYYKAISGVLLSFYYCPAIYIQTLDKFEIAALTNSNLIFMALFLAAFSILTYAFIFVFPKMLNEELESKYAHLKLSLN